ncbi:MAG: hypothetical protein HFJ29_05425 [Clostridia bacterium]|nr:hypothetical protein [Clostridia bacterium]
MKRKVIIFVSILFILGILISIIYQLCMIEEYTFTIKSIENDTIIAEKSIEVLEYIENEVVPQKQIYSYHFSANNVLIRGENGKRITILGLKPGDTIHIVRIKEWEHKDLPYEVQPLTNIKLIEVVKQSE